MKKLIYEIADIDSVAQALIADLQHCSIITLTGSLGAGKTTLTSAFLKQLGVCQPVTSPTFTYVNQYQTDTGKQVYHFDLYRLNDAVAFRQAGFCEYLDLPNSLIIIEWPEIVQHLLKGQIGMVQIKHESVGRRTVLWKMHYNKVF